MPSGERGEYQPASQTDPYYIASRFGLERPSQRAYARLQETIFGAGANLSAYRFILNRAWYVAVLGDPPPDKLDRRLRRVLATGEPCVLPTPILGYLQERRVRAKGLGPWVEGHYGSEPHC